MPSIAECKNWNARLMRHMIASKMAKNQTYQQKQEEDRAIAVRRSIVNPKLATSQVKRQAYNRETQEIRLSTQVLLGVGESHEQLFGMSKQLGAQQKITQGST